MPTALQPPASPSRPTFVSGYRAGSLVYTPSRLRAVFAWLLAGEVVFTLIDMLEPKILPVLLKLHGATDLQIAVIIGSFNAALQFLIMPPVGYYSDRLRTRWGRRVPLLLAATPVATLFLALTPFAPEFGAWLAAAVPAAWAAVLPVTPAVFAFAVLVLLFRGAQTVMNVAFFGLLRDVVPDTHMGRFLALFRVFGAFGTFVITYWLLGYAETHSRPIFLGVAALNLVGFSTLCWFVREGTYPPMETAPAPAASGVGALATAFRTFLRESYRHPVYLWVYGVRICIYGALLGLSGFLVFFPQRELGLSLPEIGATLSWPSLAWVVIAYPVGRLVDARGAIHVLRLGLALITVGYAVSFFAVMGPWSFLASSMIIGIAFWIVMLAQLKLAQEIFHPQRYSQLAGANTAVQSVVIAAVLSPAAGWLLDALAGWSCTLAVPVVGSLEVGPYRLVNLMLALLYGGAWYALRQVRRHWIACGGPHHYAPPL